MDRFSCAGCGAELAWSPGKRALACDSCGAARPVEAPAQFVAEEHALERGLPPPLPDAPPAAGGLGLKTKLQVCKGCAAEMEVPPGSKTGRCPFCGSQYVMEQVSTRECEAPESVLPLAIDLRKARELFTEWVGKGFFTPRALRKERYLEGLQGFYIPAWTFDAAAASSWTAERGHYYYTTESYRDSQGRTQTRQVRHTRWEYASGSRRDAYDDLMIPAARDDIQEFLEQAGAFNTKAGLLPYRPEYLAGWNALRYTLDRAGGWNRAQQKMEATQEARCGDDVGGDTHRNLQVQTDFSAVKYKHTLLPYWISSYKFRTKTYRFVINGETGAVAGEKPISWLKVALVVILALGAIAVIALLVKDR